MKRFTIFLIALPVLLTLVMVLLMIRLKIKRDAARPGPALSGESNRVATVSVTPVIATGGQPAFLGESILQGYADTNLPPQNDLTLMSRLMDSSILLLKSAANQPLSANEDWSALFRGQNAAHERFLPDTHVALNTHSQLVDRWSTPLFFHALGGGRYEVRSAGPDGKLWTDDDIHRNPDGSFRRGAELNPPSLRETRGNK